MTNGLIWKFRKYIIYNINTNQFHIRFNLINYTISKKYCTFQLFVNELAVISHSLI